MSDSPLIIIENEEKALTVKAQFEGEMECQLVSSIPAKPEHVIIDGAKGQKGHDYKFTPLPEEKGLFEKLAASLDRNVYIAFDDDSRGAHWSWLIEGCTAQLKNKPRLKRLPLVGIKKEEISNLLGADLEMHQEEAEANYIRSIFYLHLVRHIKRMIGTASGPANLPLNYNSLTTLFLINDRDIEGSMYSPPKKWRIVANITDNSQRGIANLTYAKDMSDDGFLNSEQDSKEFLLSLKEREFIVTKAEKNEIVIQPPMPFRLVDILREAHVMYKMQPRQVLSILRRLYYGVEINGNRTGLITAFNDGDFEIPSSVGDQLDDAVRNLFGDDALASSGSRNDIIPGMIAPLSIQIKADDVEALDEQEKGIYLLICNRALASRMNKGVGESISLELRLGDNSLFALEDRHITEKGFMQIYQEVPDRDLINESHFIEKEEGDVLPVKSLSVEHRSPFPPEYYSYETLFTELADFSMAVEPMTISMIQAMIDNDYLYMTAEGYIRPKENCRKVINTFSRALPKMKGINLSAYIEQTTAEVVSSRKTLDFALKQFNQTLMIQGKVLVQQTAAGAGALRRRQRPSSSVIKTEPKKPISQPGVDETETKATEKHEIIDGQPVEPSSEAPVMETVAEEISPDESIKKEAADGLEVQQEDAAALEEESIEALEEATAEAFESGDEQIEETLAAAEDDASKEVFDAVEPEEDSAIQLSSADAEPMVDSTDVLDGKTKPCPVCSRPMVLKSDEFGGFWNCTGFPACRYAEPEKKDEEDKVECPLCDTGVVHNKHTPTGKSFYVCSEADCEFMAWSKPHMVPCQACKSQFLVEKKDISGAVYLRCPRAGCHYKQPLPGDDGESFIAPSEPASPSKDSPSEATASAPRKKKVRIRRAAGAAGGSTSGKKRKVRIVRKKK